MKLTLAPITLRAANAFVRAHHRHHGPVRGHKASVGVEFGGQLVGVVIVGRTVARNHNQRRVCEVTRCCVVPLTKNACSKLYGAAARLGIALGYEEAVTYTLRSESGVSLRACGWTCEGETSGGSWSRPSRGRIDKHPTEPKVRWRKVLAPSSPVAKKEGE